MSKLGPSSSVATSELWTVLPYYENRPPESTVVVAMHYVHGGKSYTPFYDSKNDRYIIMNPHQLVSGTYISDAAPNPTNDFFIPLLDFVVRRFPNHRAVEQAQEIARDIASFGTIIEKCFSNHAIRPGQEPFGRHLLMAADLEYLFFKVRALYDQLQLLVRTIWQKTELLDPCVKKATMPKSFHSAVYKNTKPLSAEEMSERYGLPLALSTVYERNRDFFMSCREIRDSVTHGWHSSLSGKPVFVLGDGFAMSIHDDPFRKFKCWHPDAIKNGRLGGVAALVAHVAARSIAMTSEFTEAFVSCIKFADPMAPGWHVYVRDAYAHHLNHLSEIELHPWTSSSNSKLPPAPTADTSL